MTLVDGAHVVETVATHGGQHTQCFRVLFSIFLEDLQTEFVGLAIRSKTLGFLFTGFDWFL
jgi:hypothetical protein